MPKPHGPQARAGTGRQRVAEPVRPRRWVAGGWLRAGAWDRRWRGQEDEEAHGSDRQATGPCAGHG
jgi:hypothetical protein